MDIEKAKQRLSIFGEQKQKALTVLMSLMDKGVTESQIKGLQITVIGNNNLMVISSSR